MAKVGFRITKRLPPASKQFAAWETEVRTGLQPVIDRRAAEYAKQTSSWQSQHQPDFQGQVVRSKLGVIFFRVVIRNASKVFNKYGTTIKQLWDIWNKGSRPHAIVPRFASILRFEIGGKAIFTPRVKHPGTKGTNAQEKIDKRLRPGEISAIRRIGRLAFRKITK